MQNNAFWLFLAGLVVVVGMTSCTKEDGVRKASSEPANIESTAPAFTMTAVDFFAECQKDPQAAGEGFKGKVIELSGVVYAAFPDSAEKGGLVYLKTPEGQGDVLCVTQEKQPWARALPGSRVRIRGKWHKPNVLTSCVIVELVPIPATVISAQRLALEWADDEQTTKEKYQDKWLFVDGEVVNSTFSKSEGGLLVLKGDKAVEIRCAFGTMYETPQPVKVGEHIKVVGRADVSPSEEDVTVYGCHLVNY